MGKINTARHTVSRSWGHTFSTSGLHVDFSMTSRHRKTASAGPFCVVECDRKQPFPSKHVPL